MSDNITMLKLFLSAFSMILIVARYYLDEYSFLRIVTDGFIALMLFCYIWSTL